jgi:hypothetical protein
MNAHVAYETGDEVTDAVMLHCHGVVKQVYAQKRDEQ